MKKYWKPLIIIKIIKIAHNNISKNLFPESSPPPGGDVPVPFFPKFANKAKNTTDNTEECVEYDENQDEVEPSAKKKFLNENLKYFIINYFFIDYE